MRRIYSGHDWPASWKYSYAYDLEEVYGEVSNRGYANAYANRRQQTLQLLSEALAPGAHVLDIAAAQGNFSIALAEMGYEVTWNDLRADLADYVRLKHERGTIHFAPGNAFELDFPHCFDAVLITEVIEHTAHPDDFLAHVAKLVKPGGHIVMTTPNGAYFKNKLPKFSECANPAAHEKKQFQPDSDGHIFLLHPDEIPALAESAGLEVEETVLFTNPLTNGHMKTGALLHFLPKNLVTATETATQHFFHSLREKILVQIGVRFRKPAMHFCLFGMTMTNTQQQIRGLDSIRFFSALWVALSHGAAPPVFENIDRSQGMVRLLGAMFDTLFCGQAGVILFFIISGFCIHYPQACGRLLHVPSFYARRILRIALPLAAALFCMRMWARDATNFFQLVTWTLVCEVVYYIAYPVLRFVAGKTGWLRLVGVAYVVSYLVIAIESPGHALCGSLGWHLNVLVGLPSWLLGCLLAESFLKQPAVLHTHRIWLWRSGIWAASALCMGLMLHAGIGLPWTLSIFALLGYHYIRAEISYCRVVPPVRVFELLGMASYSMYLTHLLALHLVRGHGGSALETWLRWPLLIAAIFAMMGAFYFLVEFPSHQLARKFRAQKISTVPQ